MARNGEKTRQSHITGETERFKKKDRQKMLRIVQETQRINVEKRRLHEKIADYRGFPLSWRGDIELPRHWLLPTAGLDGFWGGCRTNTILPPHILSTAGQEGNRPASRWVEGKGQNIVHSESAEFRNPHNCRSGEHFHFGQRNYLLQGICGGVHVGWRRSCGRWVLTAQKIAGIHYFELLCSGLQDIPGCRVAFAAWG